MRASRLEAELNLDASNFDRGLKAARKELGVFRKAFGGIGTTAGGFLAANAITAGAKAAASGIKSIISSASDMNETLSKTAAVFGDDVGPEMVDWAQTAATSFGLTKQAALEYGATLGNLFRGMGLTTGAASGMSQDVVQLAADLASFNNLPVDQVLEDIRSGLVGEAEPMRKYGVLLDEATVAQKAMEMTGKDNAKMLTQQEKLLARNALIFEQTTTAQGDFARTSGGLANQLRILKAIIQDGATALGARFLPAVQSVVRFITHFITSFQKARASGLNPFQAALKAVRSSLIEVFGREATAGIRSFLKDISRVIDAFRYYRSRGVGPAEAATLALRKVFHGLIPASTYHAIQQFIAGLQTMWNVAKQAASILLDGLGKAFQFLGRHMDYVLPAIKGIGIALLVILPAITIVGIALGVLTSPIFLLIAVAALLSIAWSKNWGDIQGKTAAVIAFVLPLLQQFSAWFTGVAIPAIEAFTAVVVTFIDGQVVPVLSAIWDKVKGPLGFLADWFSRIALEAVKLWVQIHVEAIQRAVRAAEFLWNHAGPAFRALQDLVHNVASTVRAFSEVVRNHLGRARDFFVGLKDKVVEKWAGFKETIEQLGKDIIQWIVNGLDAAKDDVLSKAGEIADAVKGKLDPRNWFGGGDESGAVNALTIADEDALAIASGMIATVQTALREVANTIPVLKQWDDVRSALSDALAGVWGDPGTGKGAKAQELKFMVTIDADKDPFDDKIIAVWTSGLAFDTHVFQTGLDAEDKLFRDVFNAVDADATDWANDAYITSLSADADLFYGVLSGVRDAASTFASRTYTAAVSLNIQPALNQLAILDSYLPHSLAKRGPLSRPLSFDHLGDAFKQSMNRITGGMGTVSVQGASAAGGGLTINVMPGATINVPSGYPDFGSAMGAWARGETS